jgi:hypothetical protein
LNFSPEIRQLLSLREELRELVGDLKASAGNRSPECCAHVNWGGYEERKILKINGNQKSVLTLAGIAFGGLLISDPKIVISVSAIILWVILGLWFYGVRDKKKPD